MVIEATICHVIRGRRLLLKKASRGTSVGKWNAPGGKLEPGESPEDCARREVSEETGLRIIEPLYHGTLTYLMDGGKTLHTRAHLFSTRRATGRLRSSEEGEVRWFDLDRLPYARMWDDDNYWIPLMLLGSRFNGIFAYDEANEKVTSYEIRSRQG